MTDHKLVRDLIPDIIRKSGRHVESRYLVGSALEVALLAKLQEETAEAAAAVGNRAAVTEKLADVNEVVSALMKYHEIGHEELALAAQQKAAQRGGFEKGICLVSKVPESVRRYRAHDVDAQRVKWKPSRWLATFARHQGAFNDLSAHSEATGGIARGFIHGRAHGDPVELFLMAMAWGFGPNGYGPTRTNAVLAQDGAADKIAAIVEATRSDGAAAGWRTLLRTHKIRGLNMSFGTKLLYFAGFTTAHRPRPLVLDERVRAALHIVAPGTVPSKGTVRETDYMRYLTLAESWVTDPLWEQTPDTVEYALFALGSHRRVQLESANHQGRPISESLLAGVFVNTSGPELAWPQHCY
ncbi:hypothetical protein ABQE93_20820 [Mycolicibacterium sp. XJ662]